MSEFQPIEVTDQMKAILKQWLRAQKDLVPVASDNNSSLLTCYSLMCEVGGPNDELARFIYDEDNQRMVEKHELRAEVGILEGGHVLRISSSKSSDIGIRVPQLKETVIERTSDLIISPAVIASKIKSQNLEPVIVRDWLYRALFSDFNPRQMSYRDKLWVLRNNEVVLYAQLVSEGKIIFQDLHDITAHVSGVREAGYRFAGEVAGRIYKKLSDYFGPRGRGNLTSHLIPFLIGVILDGLTQVTIYGSETRQLAINELLQAIDHLNINPKEKLRLNGFPKGIDRINGLFQNQNEFSMEILQREIQSLLDECLQLTSHPKPSPNVAPGQIGHAFKEDFLRKIM